MVDASDLLSDPTSPVLVAEQGEEVVKNLDPVLAPAVRAFYANMDRIVLQLLYVEAVVDGSLHLATVMTLHAAHQAIADVLKQDLPAHSRENLRKQLEDRQDYQTARKKAVRTMLTAKPVRDGMAANLASTVIASWVAFECLAGDMWECAVNSRPDLLPEHLFKEKKDGGDAQRATPVWQLRKHGFDLRRVMGTIMCGRYGFTTLSSIRHAYEDVFTPSKAVFVGAGGEDDFRRDHLKILEATRHLLVHRAGVIDENYLSRWKKLLGHRCELFAFKLGDSVPVTHAIAAEFHRTAVVSGSLLFQAVDQTLKKVPA